MEGDGGPHGCPSVPPHARPHGLQHLGTWGKWGFRYHNTLHWAATPSVPQPLLVGKVRAGQQVSRDREGLGMGSCTDGPGKNWVLTCAPPRSALSFTVGVPFQALPTPPSSAADWSHR